MLPSHNTKPFDSINQNSFIFQSISTFLCLKFIALTVANMWGKPATVKIYITNIFFQDEQYRKKYHVCVREREIECTKPVTFKNQFIFHSIVSFSFYILL